jgi:hypothetical protein
MDQYHGTNTTYANEISNGQIDVNIGGGELGQGFYTGDLPHEAFNWAWHQYQRNKSVVKLIVHDEDFLNLNPLCLDLWETYRCRNTIRDVGETRSFRFQRNVIWAPVAGKCILNFNQFKYEGDSAQNYLNGTSVVKEIF